MTLGVLYISYDRMLERLGQCQVLARLRLLAAGRRIRLISFQKRGDRANIAERERVALAITGAGIVWHPLRYHKRPTSAAAAWDICRGIALGLWLGLRYRPSIVRAGSYVPKVMVPTIKRITGVNLSVRHAPLLG